MSFHPRGHDGARRKLGVSCADKSRDGEGYKQSNKKYLHGNDRVLGFHGRGVSQSSRGLVEPNARIAVALSEPPDVYESDRAKIIVVRSKFHGLGAWHHLTGD